MVIPSFDLTSSDWGNHIETLELTEENLNAILEDVVDLQMIMLQKLEPGSSNYGGLLGKLSHVHVHQARFGNRDRKKRDINPATIVEKGIGGFVGGFTEEGGKDLYKACKKQGVICPVAFIGLGQVFTVVGGIIFFFVI